MVCISYAFWPSVHLLSWSVSVFEPFLFVCYWTVGSFTYYLHEYFEYSCIWVHEYSYICKHTYIYVYINFTYIIFIYCISSVEFSRSVLSNSLQLHEPQHARPPCPSPTPGVHSDSRPSSQWCHPAISSSVVPISSCPQSFQHQGLFQWVSSLHQVAKVLEFQLQHQSYQWTLRTDFL